MSLPSLFNLIVNSYSLKLAYCVDFFQGDLVDAVVPFMGESISDGTLAAFLKSMFLCSVKICVFH